MIRTRTPIQVQFDASRMAKDLGVSVDKLVDGYKRIRSPDVRQFLLENANNPNQWRNLLNHGEFYVDGYLITGKVKTTTGDAQLNVYTGNDVVSVTWNENVVTNIRIALASFWDFLNRNWQILTSVGVGIIAGGIVVAVGGGISTATGVGASVAVGTYLYTTTKTK